MFLFSHMRKWRPSQADPARTLDEKKFPLKKKSGPDLSILCKFRVSQNRSWLGCGENIIKNIRHNFSYDVLTFTFASAEVIETEVISTRVVWFFSSRKKTLQIKNVWSLKYSTLREVLWVQISKGSMRRVELWETKIEYSLMIGQQDDLSRPRWLNPGNVINYYYTD
jgi:hypothetical protein